MKPYLSLNAAVFAAKQPVIMPRLRILQRHLKFITAQKPRFSGLFARL
jgi:hypothetical protein